jgi:hypothetical protein
MDAALTRRTRQDIRSSRDNGVIDECSTRYADADRYEKLAEAEGDAQDMRRIPNNYCPWRRSIPRAKAKMAMTMELTP